MMNIENAATDYYDSHVGGKLDGFVLANPRVERAALTIERHAPRQISRILEVGCGIGDISWRMSRQWPSAQVIGVDTSPKSIELAQKLFQKDNLSYVCGLLSPELVSGPFDLIVMMDVYEHIGFDDRPTLHQTLKALLSDNGRLIMAFPTPRNLKYLREHVPSKIQPVDEDVTIESMLTLGQDLGVAVLMYFEVDIWNSCDYAHAVLGARGKWEEPNPDRLLMGRREKVKKALQRDSVLSSVDKRTREEIIDRAVGIETYRKISLANQKPIT